MNDIATTQQSSMALTPAGVKEHVNTIAQLMRDVLQKDEHYGAIPGVKAADVVYSLAWGDQPALICEHVDWARACGFTVVAAPESGDKLTRFGPFSSQCRGGNVKILHGP